jgi:hypothetical protein
MDDMIRDKVEKEQLSARDFVSTLLGAWSDYRKAHQILKSYGDRRRLNDVISHVKLLLDQGSLHTPRGTFSYDWVNVPSNKQVVIFKPFAHK